MPVWPLSNLVPAELAAEHIAADKISGDTEVARIADPASPELTGFHIRIGPRSGSRSPNLDGCGVNRFSP
jgi:hypothetical protein